jgi:hypothetical protein
MAGFYWLSFLLASFSASDDEDEEELLLQLLCRLLVDKIERLLEPSLGLRTDIFKLKSTLCLACFFSFAWRKVWSTLMAILSFSSF